MLQWLFIILLIFPFILIFPVLFSLLVIRLLYGSVYAQKVVHNVKRDLRGLAILFHLKWRCAKAFRRNRGIHEMFLETVEKFPDKTALIDISTDQAISFRELNSLSCQYAHLLQAHNVKHGDAVCLILGNGIPFVAAWMACAKIGAISAWTNTNLKHQSLAHSMKQSKSRIVICNADYVQNLNEVFEEHLSRSDWTVLVQGDSGSESIENALKSYPIKEPVSSKPVRFTDPLCYIFTSGTTGLPKAAVIKHFRYFYIATSGELAFGMNSNDRLYICLPMFHTSAGVLGLGQTILQGTTCILRSKFSASRFWNDCRLYKCTVAQYIGEMLRYLLATPESEDERHHSIRLLVGNGLRPAVWRRFQERFNVGRIAEFYGSTEGTSNLVNIDGKEGSCGFMPIVPFIEKVYPVRLFRIDEDGVLLRDKNNYLIPCKPGEFGALACTIKKNNPLYHFEGYVDENETKKKVVQEPLPGAEPVFLSGDILHWDRRGYFYFKDRTGDTFRWKGENVSTTEVETQLCIVPGIVECAVYGIEIPGCEGRAGMAALVLREDVDIHDLLDRIAIDIPKALPPYAVPIFIRVLSNISFTATFKMKKTELVHQGFSAQPNSKVFVLKSKKYQMLTDEARELIYNEKWSF